MKLVLIFWFLGWTSFMAQIWKGVDAGTSEDVRKRAEYYDTITQTLQSLLIKEKSLNRKYLRERSENWFQTWKTELHWSAFYDGYLGCNPEQVLDVISLIRLKLESDSLTCMDNKVAEYEQIYNESVKLSQAAQKLAKSMQSHAGLESTHYDAILECLPDLESNPNPGPYTPPRIQRIVATAPKMLSDWKRFQESFLELRRACFDFHSMEYHGTTADIVLLFEECVRGDMKDWVEDDLHSFEILFKVIYQHSYMRAAELKRSLTGIFEKATQTIIETVRESHTVQATDLIEQYENRNRSTAQCRFHLPRLKMLSSHLIRDAYRCLHGTYMNYLDSHKLIDLFAIDINRLTTHSSHQTVGLQRDNITVQEALYHIQNNVVPPFETAQTTELRMEGQYENDVLNMRTHFEMAFQCVQNTLYSADKVSLEVSKEYVECSNRVSKQEILINKLGSNTPSDIDLHIETLYNEAFHAFWISVNWRNRLEHLLTITPNTTPICQTECAVKAFAQITKLESACRAECTRHLTQVRIQLKDATEKAESFRKLILNEDDKDLAHQCHQQAIFVLDQTAEKFQINEQICGGDFDRHRDDESIMSEFRNCFKLKCGRTWRYILGL